MFRWFFAEAREILNVLDGSQKWRAALFSKWFAERCLDGLHHHHDAEEKFYNPLITDKGGKLTPSITADHKAIMDGVDKAKSLLKQIEAGQTQLLPEFKTFILDWMKMCEEHLADEETQYPQQLRECNISQQEEGAAVEKIIQDLGLGGNKVMLPPIVYCMCKWGGEERMQQFFQVIPPPIQMMLQKCWLDDFWVNNLCVIEALKNPSCDEYIPAQAQCGLCIVQ